MLYVPALLVVVLSARLAFFFRGSGCVIIGFGPSVLSSRPSPPAPLSWSRKKFERRKRDAREERGGRSKEAKAKTRAGCNGHSKQLSSHNNSLSDKETRRGESASSRDTVS